MKEPGLDKLIELYDYRQDASLHQADRALLTRMLRYAGGINGFGRQMTAHQNRVARDGAAFLRHLGYNERAARNFRAAMLFHDIGKTHDSYDPNIWLLPDRPTPEQKTLQKRHTRLGAEMLEKLAAPALRDHPHFAVRQALVLYHHERADGGGPEKTDAGTMPLFLQAACLVDAYDGDRIRRGHQSLQRAPAEALARLSDENGKYAGAFAPALVSEYAAMKMRNLSSPAPVV